MDQGGIALEKKRLTAIRAAVEAGRKIMEVYDRDDFQVESKSDDSPLTIADLEANRIINKHLLETGTPIISEENAEIPFDLRRKWKECWIVDPLDGTKEFIKRNGEFTVNIALIINGRPVFGVIFAPALNLLYIGDLQKGRSWKVVNPLLQNGLEILFNDAEVIKPAMPAEDNIRVVGSRSHMNKETEQYIEELRSKHPEVEIVAKGSSLKFCLVAEGAAHVYPRFAPTMEWDTAAGQAICEAVGLKCNFRKTGSAVSYNRKNLLNDHFLVSYEG
jgi:3'(2'), 5'-bisphosphate nucleotidase